MKGHTIFLLFVFAISSIQCSLRNMIKQHEASENNLRETSTSSGIVTSLPWISSFPESEEIEDANDLQFTPNEDFSSASSSGTQGLIAFTNGIQSNELLVYIRSQRTPYTYEAVKYATGGLGTGILLNNQYSIAVKNNLVFVINPGSRTVSSFSISRNGIFTRRSVVVSGESPYSLDVYGNILVVLNAGNLTVTSDNVPISPTLQSFRISSNGTLTRISGGLLTIPFASNTIFVQVSFTANGRQLVVSNFALGLFSISITTSGRMTYQNTIADAGVPFGFEITSNNAVIVSNVGSGSVSSYLLNNVTGEFTFLNSVPTGGFACWVQLTSDEKYAFITNNMVNTISTLKINPSGKVRVNQLVAAQTNAMPLDLALSTDGSYLYVVGDLGDIQSYAVNEGVLTFVHTITPIVDTFRGLGYFSV